VSKKSAPPYGYWGLWFTFRLRVDNNCSQLTNRLTDRRGLTYVSELEGDLEVSGEVCGELGVLVEYFEEIVFVNVVKVTVGQSSHVAARLARRLIHAHVFAKHVFLAYTHTPADLHSKPSDIKKLY